MRGKFDTLFSSKRTFSHTSIHQKIQLIAHHSSNFSNDHKELNLRPPHQANPPQKKFQVLLQFNYGNVHFEVMVWQIIKYSTILIVFTKENDFLILV